MKKTISYFQGGKGLINGILLVGAFMFFNAGSATAQQFQQANGTANPYTDLAAKMNVTAYPFGTFDRDHTMEVMDGILHGLKQVIGSGTATNSQKLKYEYCNAVLSDISTQYIAVEIALLTSLSELNMKQNTPASQQSQLATLYNEIVAQIQ